MALVKTEGKYVFDTTQIQRGFFIVGRHRSWLHPVNGLVASVAEGELLVQFLPKIRNVTNHYHVRADEVESGEWELHISPDLVTVEEVVPDGTA